MAEPDAGAGQRRPRPAGRVLPRLARHARPARLRLRHQLRVRPVPPGDPRRRADRAARQLAARRHARGRSSGPSERVHRAALRPHRAQRRPRRQLQPDVARLEGRSSACRTTCRSSATAARPSTSCGSSRRAASDDFDMRIFNDGDYLRAVEQKIASETVSKVLYPSDAPSGPRAAADAGVLPGRLRDPRHRPALPARSHGTFDDLPDKVAIQLNDTHPALAVAELMRHPRRRARPGVGRRRGTITHGDVRATPTTRSCPRRWRSGRCRCSSRSCRGTCRSSTRSTAASSSRSRTRWPGDDERAAAHVARSRRASSKQVRMAHLAIVGSHSVNGVAALHTRAGARRTWCRTSHALWPEQVQQQDQRRHAAALAAARNPALAALITDAIGDGWVTDLDALRELEPLADDAGVPASVRRGQARATRSGSPRSIRDDDRRARRSAIAVRRAGQAHPRVQAAAAERCCTSSTQYLQPGEDGERADARRGRTSSPARRRPATRLAKQIIRLINDVGDVVNRDPRARERLKVVFLPDYRVSLAEDHPGRRPERADLDGRHRGVAAPAT